MDTKAVFSKITPYAISIVSTLVCLAIALGVFYSLNKSSGVILFLPAVLITSWFAGFRPGLFATILSILAIFYFFVPPYASLWDKPLVTSIQLVIFFFEGLTISYIIDNGHRHEKIRRYQKIEKELMQKTQELENKLSSAQGEIASRDEFLSIASHELKTPLTTVLLQIQKSLHNIQNVSLAQFSVQDLVHMLQSTQNQTKRLSKMINDLLNVSLITTHRLELEPEEMDLTTLTKDIVENDAPRFEKGGSSLTLEADKSIMGKWDKLRIEQAIENIISNALKYGNKKPVEVKLSKEKSMAILTVRDRGIGIPNSQKKRIFQLFKRGVSAKDYKGLGVGLYIAQHIVEQHGGHIDVESGTDGTTFTIYLPIQS